MHKHTKVFEKLSDNKVTYKEIAEHCGVTVTKAHRWNVPLPGQRQKGIPYKYFPAIVSLAKSRHIDLSLADLKKIEIEEIKKIFDSFE